MALQEFISLHSGACQRKNWHFGLVCHQELLVNHASTSNGYKKIDGIQEWNGLAEPIVAGDGYRRGPQAVAFAFIRDKSD